MTRKASIFLVPLLLAVGGCTKKVYVEAKYSRVGVVVNFFKDSQQKYKSTVCVWSLKINRSNDDKELINLQSKDYCVEIQSIVINDQQHAMQMSGSLGLLRGSGKVYVELVGNGQRGRSDDFEALD